MVYRKHWSQLNQKTGMQEPTSKPADAAGKTQKELAGQPEDSRYVMTPEAGTILNLSPRTLERMRVDGTGPKYSKAGGGIRSRVLYKVSDLYDWLESRSFTSTSQYEE